MLAAVRAAATTAAAAVAAVAAAAMAFNASSKAVPEWLIQKPGYGAPRGYPS